MDLKPYIKPSPGNPRVDASVLFLAVDRWVTLGGGANPTPTEHILKVVLR